MLYTAKKAGRNRALIIPGALILAATVLLIPPPADTGLLEFYNRSRGLGAIFVLCLVFWATEVLPIAVTALLALVLQPLFGVAELRDAFQSFISPVFFFVIAMFIIAGVIIEVGLDRRFALFLLNRAGTNPRNILFAMMAGTALLSTIMSDVPACAVFMAVGIGLLDQVKADKEDPAFARALMLGIPIAALIGGIATPAGSSINVLALDLLDTFSRQNSLALHISFLQWMALGVPMVILLLPLAWRVLLVYHTPQTTSFALPVRDKLASGSKPWQDGERKVIVILGIMLLLWMAGSWIKALNVTLVAMLGAIVMFFPRVNLISWRKAESCIGWDTVLMIGGVTSLGQASVKTGLAEWLVQGVVSGIAGWPLFWIIFALCLLTVLIHLPLPIAPVVNAVLIPPIASLALALDSNPILFVLPVAFTASCAFLLPLDAVPLLTYTKGYYRMSDMLLPGSIISLAWVLLMSVLIVSIGPLVGLF